MYEAIRDPYCFAGTKVLKNKFGLRDQKDIDRLEFVLTAQRMAEGLPRGRLTVSHYKAIHHHLFQDIYDWAGKFRIVRIAKGKSMFCYPEHIDRQMRLLFSKLKEETSSGGMESHQIATTTANFISDLNAIHPFRDGNGRCQLAILAVMCEHMGLPADISKLQPRAFLRAMIAGFQGELSPLTREIDRLLRQRPGKSR